MKLVILEPLGIAKEDLMSIANKTLHGDMDITYYDTRTEEKDILIERSKDADVVVLSNFSYPKEVIANCPNLKMICVAFTGVDHVDVDYCNEHGIMVCNCAGYSTVAVADLVFGFVIDLYRNILPCNETVRQEGTKDGLIGSELAGKKFGIIGTGAIGQRVAKIAHAFDCEVYAYSRTKRDHVCAAYVDFDTLLSTCDIISLHVPLNESTKGLIGKDNLKLMKKSAILINTARGPVVDSIALADALRNGEIAGAAVDVFEMEPPVPNNHPLFSVPNLIATPHIAFASHQAMEKRAVIVMENIRKWLDKCPQNVQ